MKLRSLVCAILLTSLTVSTHSDDFQSQPLPSVPDISGGVGLIDQHKERMIGEKVYREAQRQLPISKHPWLEDQLYNTFIHILSQTQHGRTPIGLMLVRDTQINAFAVPGGLFAINLGLITSARNMDEVAGVMAHEIAHVTQRHYSRSQDAFKGQGLLALAGILVGALVASQADGDAGAALMVGTQAAMMDKQLTYSRNQEREADRIGMQYMYAAGFNPHGMADFFEVMHRATSRISYFPDFWLTHPLTTERMSEARLRANQLPVVKSNPQDVQFAIIKWYCKVLMGQTSESELKLMAERGYIAGQLALAAFYLKQSDFQLAQNVLNQVKAQNASDSLFLLIQADLYLAQKKFDAALHLLETPVKLMPENRALTYKLAEVLIEKKDSQAVYDLVQPFVQQNARDTVGWNLLQQAANREQASPYKAANVLRYRAEVEFWTGYEEDAIKSMLHAQRLSKNNAAMNAKVKQRLKDMQADRRYRI